MGLRITQGMLTRFALRDITNNARGLHQYRMQLSTGYRVNRPSDDPNSFLRILPLQSEIKELERYQSNADLASDLVDTAASAFEDASALMARAKELAVQGANGTIGDSDRDTLAASINEILVQMISIANSKLGDRYLFGGSSTSQQPFELSSSNGRSRTFYNGNDREVTIDIAPGSPVIVSSSGRELFMSTKRGATKLNGSTGIQTGSGTDSGRGRAVLTIEHTGFTGLPAGVTAGSQPSVGLGTHNYTITSGPSTISIGGGPAVPFDNTSTNLPVTIGTTGEVVFLDMSAYTGGATSGSLTSTARMNWDGETWTNVDFAASNQQVLDKAGLVLNLDARNLKAAGNTEVHFSGTFDPFESLTALRDILENDENLNSSEVSRRVTEIIGEIDNGTEIILEGLRKLGARGSQVDLSKNRMGRLEIALTESLSQERDIDYSEAILKMTQRDTAYQASLAVGARVMSRTLLDFLA